jgi:hypothetical protein
MFTFIHFFTILVLQNYGFFYLQALFAIFFICSEKHSIVESESSPCPPLKGKSGKQGNGGNWFFPDFSGFSDFPHFPISPIFPNNKVIRVHPEFILATKVALINKVYSRCRLY